MWTYVLLAVLAVIVLVAYLVLRQPDTFKVQRSAVIAAPPATVFALVNDLRLWNDWSPWAKLDPNAKNTFQGPTSGPGAGFAWSGNNKVGEGRMTIVESRPGEHVRIKLEFMRPMKATNDTLFTFTPDGAGTRVTWTMSGHNALTGKAINLVMDCDRMVGQQFEQGLANLAERAKQR